jgi:F0F1-type ATP synthase alpha subunit
VAAALMCRCDVCSHLHLQAGSGVRCVYASVGQSQQRQQAALAALQDSGAMAYTTAVVAPEGAPFTACIGYAVVKPGRAVSFLAAAFLYMHLALRGDAQAAVSFQRCVCSS